MPHVLRLFAVSSALLVSMSIGSSSLAQCRFDDPVELDPRVARLGDVIVTDLNQDGRPDIVAAPEDDLELLLFPGVGGGAFQAVGRLPLPSAANRLEARDLNRDGRTDLVALLGNRSFAVLLSLGGGAFSPAVEYRVDATPSTFLVADLNGDGHPDIAATRASGTAVVLPGKGDGSFQPAVPLAQYGSVLASGDFNVDGKPDLAIVRNMELLVLPGDGAGAFPGVLSTSLREVPDGIGAADLNGDGKTDLVLPKWRNPGLSVTVLVSNGDGTFSSSQALAPYAETWSEGPQLRFVIDDLDGDGHPDVLFRSRDYFPGNIDPSQRLGALTLFRGAGWGGRLTPPVSFPASPGLPRSALATGDFNEDGRPDVATPGGIQPSYVSVLLNGCGIGEWILPSSARSQGAGGAFYTTDLSVFNPSHLAGSFTLRFLGHDVDGRTGPTATFSIPARSGNTYRDILGTVFGRASDYGALLVTSDVTDLAVIGQTSTPGGGGTFGQSVPALRRSDGIGLVGRSERSIPGVREDDLFRTNLILVNASDVRVQANVVLYAEGEMAQGKFYSLLPKQMIQVSRIVRELGVTSQVTNAALIIRMPTPGGGLHPSSAVVAYAVVIDNRTNDPRTIVAR